MLRTIADFLIPLLLLLSLAGNAMPKKPACMPDRDTVPAIDQTQASPILQKIVDHQLFVGDQVPTDIVTLPKAPLIILDFWNIWCSSCIKSMPHMEKLQEEFGDNIKVILVTGNSDAEVEKLKSHNKIVSSIQLLMINADTILSSMFPAVTFPTHVWLDSNLRVLQITNNYNTTPAAVQSYFDGNKVQLAIKKELVDFDLDKPLWMEGNGRQTGNLQSYSLFMNAIDYRPHIGTSETRPGSAGPSLSRLINYSIYDLYEAAFTGKFKWTMFEFAPRCRIVSNRKLQILGPGIGPAFDKWAKENKWCYEIRVKSGDESKLYETMRADIDRFFNLKSKLVSQKTKCLVLSKLLAKKTGNKTILQNEIRVADSEQSTIIRDKTIKQSLILYIQSAYPKKIVLDQTNDTSKINLAINCRFDNYPELKRQLRLAGFTLQKKMIYTNVIVISDK